MTRWEEQQAENDALRNKLIPNIKARFLELAEVLKDVSWREEDSFYRYYYQSFKVYQLQHATLQIVKALKSILPERELNKTFIQIVSEGTGKEWELDHNKEWSKHTRPILEAFYHAKYFLENIIKYGARLDGSPDLLPSGWAAVLCLYNLR